MEPGDIQLLLLQTAPKDWHIGLLNKISACAVNKTSALFSNIKKVRTSMCTIIHLATFVFAALRTQNRMGFF